MSGDQDNKSPVNREVHAGICGSRGPRCPRLPDPRRIRERVKLTHPVEQFPYGTRETTNNTDLDHIQPFKPNRPPGQTSTANLAPLGRTSHRVKTHSGWQVQRLDDGALEWTTRYGYKFRVDHTGTRPITDQP